MSVSCSERHKQPPDATRCNGGAVRRRAFFFFSFFIIIIMARSCGEKDEIRDGERIHQLSVIRMMLN